MHVYKLQIDCISIHMFAPTLQSVRLSGQLIIYATQGCRTPACSAQHLHCRSIPNSSPYLCPLPWPIYKFDPPTLFRTTI